ncbi:MBL fold metallo-hydrolase [candidate division KSB1 bacterium]|nr:MAG: MBL fold metallo-hydrolase [candidate division KSB1 bacterium]
MKIQFWGAVRTVTGSRHLVMTENRKILLDCGLFQGHRQEANEKNQNFHFDPAEISSMILSHAHIDHSGNIPHLVRSGFQGNIHATSATLDLCSVMLRDSAHIQEKDAEYVNKKHARKGLPLVEPLYTTEDARQSLNSFVGYGYNRWFFVANGVKAIFREAGHILGSAQVLLEVNENGRQTRLLFTGDLGRKHIPILRDPFQVEEIDYLIIESTYGGRYHAPVTEVKNELAAVVSRTVARGGKIIVPAFSVGRTQELVYYLHELFNEKKIPEIPIFVDSPLSVNVTEVFRLHPECYDAETEDLFLRHNEDPFGFERLQYIRKVEESKQLNNHKGSCIIISASGMCEAGRILHHLKNNIENPANTILIVGYMAQNTLGRKLVERWKKVKIFGEQYDLRSEVIVMNAFSAHADRRELLDYISHLNLTRLKGIYLVHGEEDQIEALKDGIQELGYQRVYIPVEGEIYDLT